MELRDSIISDFRADGMLSEKISHVLELIDRKIIRYARRGQERKQPTPFVVKGSSLGLAGLNSPWLATASGLKDILDDEFVGIPKAF